jgi:FtsP/CotA-like multicopper oxidase with cupredoxin domain
MTERNVLGERISRGAWRDMVRAARRRAELIAARVTRRDLLKSGLLTAGGYLVAKRGLSARSGAFVADLQAASPRVTPFVDPLPIMPIKSPVPALTPEPALVPNLAAGEARTRPHQAWIEFPPVELYQVSQRLAPVTLSPSLPTQQMWGYDGIVPGPTYVARYGRPILIRNFNQLPLQNGGFGINSVSTHLHNGHTPSESDGFPCDFFDSNRWYDQHYPNVLAGILSTHPGTGDVNESLSTLWYHDHRIDFTAQNTYKGLVGFYLLFNNLDTGDEGSGFRLPSFPEFDIPMAFADKVFDPLDGTLNFDLFNLDGVLGDTFTVNGKVQPFLEVHPRRYRFRWLNVGPSRFYELFLTDPSNAGAQNAFWQISSDGNLLPQPLQVTSVRLGVAERADVVIDFAPFAGRSIYIENRLQQLSGRGPSGALLAPGQGNQLLRIDVVLPPVADQSRDPAAIARFYAVPSAAEPPAVTRTFQFSRTNGQWTVNGRFMDCSGVRFSVTQNSAEIWQLNGTSSWQHPMHVHLEEHQILARNGLAPPIDERGRKDVTRLQEVERVDIFTRFRDWTGRYVMHCHNLVHEDHAMMIRFDVDPRGDTNGQP